VGIYEASRDTERRLFPINVLKTYQSNPGLQRYMRENGIPLPERDFIFFPDQFATLGKHVGFGTFGK